MLLSKFAGLSLIPQNPADTTAGTPGGLAEDSALSKYQQEKALDRDQVTARFMTQGERDLIIRGESALSAAKFRFERW